MLLFKNNCFYKLSERMTPSHMEVTLQCTPSYLRGVYSIHYIDIDISIYRYRYIYLWISSPRRAHCSANKVCFYFFLNAIASLSSTPVSHLIHQSQILSNFHITGVSNIIKFLLGLLLDVLTVLKNINKD